MPDKTGPANSVMKVIHPKFWDEHMVLASRFIDQGWMSLDKLASPHELSLDVVRTSTTDSQEPIPPPITEDLEQAEPLMHPANSAFLEVGYSYDWRDALNAKIEAYERESYAYDSYVEHEHLRLEIAGVKLWVKATAYVQAWPFDPEIQYGFPLLAFLPECEDQYLGLPCWHGGAEGVHAYLTKRVKACRTAEETAVLLAMATSQRRCLEAKYGASIVKVFRPTLMVIDGHKAHFVTAEVPSSYLDSLAAAKRSKDLVDSVSFWTTSPKLDLRDKDDQKKCGRIQDSIVLRFENLLKTLKPKTSPLRGLVGREPNKHSRR